MKNKKFDCVEMKRKSQEEIYKDIKKMTPAEELDFWHKGTLKLKEKQSSIIKKNKTA
jgi:hypothetical protein